MQVWQRAERAEATPKAEPLAVYLAGGRAALQVSAWSSVAGAGRQWISVLRSGARYQKLYAIFVRVILPR